MKKPHEITTLEEAKAFWNEFNTAHNLPSNNKPRQTTPALTESDLRNFLDQFKIETLSETKRVNINTGLINETEIQVFFNSPTVEISLDLSKLNLLKDFFEAEFLPDNWIEIFKDRELTLIAKTLYILGKINNYDLVDFLDYSEILTNENDKFELRVYDQLFDKENQPSDNVREKLIPILEAPTNSNVLPIQNFEPFLLLMATLPARFKVFIATTFGKYLPDINDQDYVGEQRIFSYLYKNGFITEIFLNHAGCILHLPPSAKETLEMVRYNKIFKLKLIQNRIKIDKMEQHQEQFSERLGNIATQLKRLHDADKPSPWLITVHDGYHGVLNLTLPENFLNILNLFKAKTRTLLGMQWCHEIWSLFVDREYTFFYQNLDLLYEATPQAVTETFFRALLLAKSHANLLFVHVTEASYPTPFFIVMLLCVRYSSEEFMQLNFDPQYFIPKVYDAYKNIDTIFDSIKTDSETKQILKCYYYCTCKLKDWDWNTEVKKINSMDEKALKLTKFPSTIDQEKVFKFGIEHQGREFHPIMFHLRSAVSGFPFFLTKPGETQTMETKTEESSFSP